MIPELDTTTKQRAVEIINGTAKNVNKDKGLDNLILWALDNHRRKQIIKNHPPGPR